MSCAFPIISGGAIPPSPPLLLFPGGPIPPDPPWERLPVPPNPLGPLGVGAGKWVTLADRIPVFDQPFDDLGRPRRRDRVLAPARDDGAEHRGMTDGGARQRRAGVLAGDAEPARRRRDDQPPLRRVAVALVRDGGGKMLLDQVARRVELIRGLEGQLGHAWQGPSACRPAAAR